MKKALLPVITFARVDIKRLFRDKVAIFFVFIFPMIFLVIFGNIFGGNNDVSFRVAVINQSSSEFSQNFVKQAEEDKAFDVDKNLTTVEKAKEKMNRGQLDATIVLPEDFGQIKDQKYPSGEAQILYDQNNQSAGQTLSTIMQGIFKDINQGIVKAPEPFTVKAESTATAGLSPFDYVFSGLLGFTLLSLGIFGPTQVFPRLKQRGVLRRYKSTPLKIWQYFSGNLISNATVGLLAIGLMFVAAFTIFDLQMRGNYFNLAVVVVLGTVMLYGIGLSIGGWAKNENQAAPLSQLVALPMMFLSGVFFPTFLMPELLQKITQYIPLTSFVDSARFIITEGKSLLELGPQLAIMGAWIVAIYFIAFKVFRWE